jgi:hypothetical protein
MHPERARPPSQPHPPGEPYVRSSTLADPPTVANPLTRLLGHLAKLVVAESIFLGKYAALLGG